MTYSVSPIMELSLQMIMITGPHISMLCSSAARIGLLEQDESLQNTKWKQDRFDTKKYHAHWLTLLKSKVSDNWLWHRDIRVLARLWQPSPRYNTVCAESLGAVACINTLDMLCFVGWNEKIEENERQTCWLNPHFHSCLPQSFNVVLRISALYLRISVLRPPTLN